MATLNELFSIHGIVVYDIGDGRIILRTPNAIISVAVNTDTHGHDLTSVSCVSDAPFTIKRLDSGMPSVSAAFCTLHPDYQENRS